MVIYFTWAWSPALLHPRCSWPHEPGKGTHHANSWYHCRYHLPLKRWGAVTLYQSHVKTESLQLILKKHQQIESTVRKQQQRAFLQMKTVAWVRGRVSSSVFCVGTTKRNWHHPSMGGRSPAAKGSPKDNPKETDSSYSDNSLELNLTVHINFKCPVCGVTKAGCVSREGHMQWQLHWMLPQPPVTCGPGCPCPQFVTKHPHPKQRPVCQQPEVAGPWGGFQAYWCLKIPKFIPVKRKLSDLFVSKNTKNYTSKKKTFRPVGV